ncbi:YybH family protein [Rhodanobacter terrae]|uniref:YybH family protein n=1 Tax=Rhodanobacter terrae TaxID=418647 RepID=A0ABW0STA2_9GAMM
MAGRRFSLLLGFLLAVTGPGRAASTMPATADDAAAIRQVMDQQQSAWNRGDVAQYMRGYKDAPDTTFVGTSVRKGYRAILDSYRKHYASREQMGRLTFSALDVRLLPGTDGEVRYAAVTGRFHLDRTAHGETSKDDGVFSLLWEKTPDGWKIILDHSS